MSAVLRVSNLKKNYGDTPAVQGVSFSVNRGEIVGLLGPNGAGKTTTISMVLGVLEPTAGSIVIENFDLERQRSKALSATNFAAVYAPLPGNLTVAQNLKVFGLIYDVPNVNARISEVMAEMGIEKFRNVKTGLLSSGEGARVNLAKAMLNRPHLLLLDEPTASLDPSMASEIRAKIRGFAARGDGGVLWTSHNMQEVEDVCDRVLFLSKGRVLLEGDPRTLPADHGKATLEDLFIAVAREPLSLGSVS